MKTRVAKQFGSRVLLLGLISLTLGIGDLKLARADDGLGVWDGALWRVKLTPEQVRRPKAADAVPMSAIYRVEKLVLYQSEGPNDKKKGREIGKSMPVKGAKEPTINVEFHEFLVNNKEHKLHVKISGKALKLKKVPKEQQWEGLFVDSDGWHWDMKLTRIQE